MLKRRNLVVSSLGEPWGGRLRVTLTADELVLALIAVVRAVDPRMLQSGPDGFTVDFAGLENKKDLTGDEILLLKLRAAIETEGASGRALELDAAEARRLGECLGTLERLREWPADAVMLCRKLRERLETVE